MMKYSVPIVILVVISVLWFSRKKESIQGLQNRVVKDHISKDKEVLKGKLKDYKEVAKHLKVDKNDYEEKVSLNKRNYLVSKSLGATLEKSYQGKMGPIVARQSGYVIFKKVSKDTSLKVLRDPNKPVRLLATGKIVVSEKDESVSENYFKGLGFEKVDRVQRLNMTLYQAPSGFSLSRYEEVLQNLPSAASGTWELIGSPIKLR